MNTKRWGFKLADFPPNFKTWQAWCEACRARRFIRCIKKCDEETGEIYFDYVCSECASLLWKIYRVNSAERAAMRSEEERLDCVRRIVHDYANFVSSAEIMFSGCHSGRSIEPPINTHVYHAFLLNCRKLMDFLGRCRKQPDDVTAADYVDSFGLSLSKFDSLRKAVNKQLQHITYITIGDLSKEAKRDLYDELKAAWKDFRGQLLNPFATKFEQEIKATLNKSEFQGLDLC